MNGNIWTVLISVVVKVKEWWKGIRNKIDLLN